MNVVAVSTQNTTFGYLFADRFPATLSIVRDVEHFSGWVDMIESKGSRVMVVPTHLTTLVQFIGSNECSFLSIILFFLFKVVFVRSQVVS